MIKGAINRPVTVSMFLLAISLFGYISLDRLALNLLPDISYPTLTIQTEYADAAPEEVESLITRPIEEAVGVLPGLTRLSSVSRPGQSEVVLEFQWAPRWIARVLKREKNSMWFSCLATLNARSCCDSILRTTRSCDSVCPGRT